MASQQNDSDKTPDLGKYWKLDPRSPLDLNASNNRSTASLPLPQYAKDPSIFSRKAMFGTGRGASDAPPNIYSLRDSSNDHSNIDRSGKRHSLRLEKKASLTSLVSRTPPQDIWEEASTPSVKVGSGSLKRDNETKSVVGSNKSSSVGRFLDKLTGKPRERKSTPPPKDYVSKWNARRENMETRSLYSSPAISEEDDEFDFIQPDVDESPSDILERAARRKKSDSTRSVSTSRTSPRFPDRRNNSSLSVQLSNSGCCDASETSVSAPLSLSIMGPKEVFSQEPTIPLDTGLSVSSPSDDHTQAPVANTLPSRILSMTAPVEVYSQAPVLPSSSTETDMKIHSQELMSPSANLSLMAPKTIYSQNPIPPPLNLSLMDPMELFSQPPVHQPQIGITQPEALITILGFMVSEALTFALQHASEEVSNNLMGRMFSGFLFGIFFNIVIHLLCQGSIRRLPEDVAFGVGRMFGYIVALVRAGIQGFQDVNGT